MRSILLFVAIALLAGENPITPQTPRDPEVVLTQTREKLKSLAHALETYSCIETVDRKYFRRIVPVTAPAVAIAPQSSCGQALSAKGSHSDLALESTDRLRLEVAMAGDGEIHSWPGATRFDGRAVDQFIQDGPVSTGTFATYLIDVFDNPNVNFQYVGESAADGSKALEYHYRVPLEASHYRVKAGATRVTVAYQGSFWVKPDSLELQRLTIRTDEAASGMPICQAAATLDYHSLHVGDSDVLLPRQAELQIVLEDQRETRSATTFSNCRQYRTESALRFEENTGEDVTAVQPLVRSAVPLPIGLPIILAMDTALDTDSAAAGDPVTAHVVKPVHRPGSSAVLIPAGAKVRGRITRLEHHLLPNAYFLVGLSFNRLEEQNISSPFAARFEGDLELARELGANLVVRERGLAFWDVGFFLFPTHKSRYVLPAGYESKWMTLATPGR